MVTILYEFSKRLGLRNVARITIQNKSFLTIVPFDPLRDDTIDNRITDQFTRIHLFLGLAAVSGFVRDGLAEHVTGRDLRNSQVLDDRASLSALTRSGMPQQDHDLATH